jgi:hypothetical protein
LERAVLNQSTMLVCATHQTHLICIKTAKNSESAKTRYGMITFRKLQSNFPSASLKHMM